MRVFIQRLLTESDLIANGGPTGGWVQRQIGDGGAFDQFVQAVADRNFDPPIPTTADPLCYALKIQETGGAELTYYLIGSYYGGEECLAAAYEYVEFKREFFPLMAINRTTVVVCEDDEHPSTHPNVIPTLDRNNMLTMVGYWLASDPDTYVSVA
jgi:hypothetical protein